MATLRITFLSALWLLLLSLSFPDCAFASLLEDGDDFSNNLVSDLAPILALFGEKVTTQFMSQSTGWADCIMLSMAPVGIVTIIVSAIRVGGYRWLKAIVGRARENIVAAELEVMSSTSHEACELWNGRTVVRCPGSADICEFICIYPTASRNAKLVVKNGGIKFVRIMDIIEATEPASEEENMSGKGDNSEDKSKHAGFRYLKIQEKKRKTFYKAALHLWMKLAGAWYIISQVFKNMKYMSAIGILQRIKNIPKTSGATGDGRDSSTISKTERGEAPSLPGMHQQQDVQLLSPMVDTLADGGTAEGDRHPRDNPKPEPDTSLVNVQNLRDNEIVIVRNPRHPAPNLSLNCRADDKRWHLWIYAIVGIIIQAGVLVYFGFVTEYRTLRFEKDGSKVEDYAMPLVITGSVLLVFGMLICSHVVESSSSETVHEVRDLNTERTTAVAMVWLQKERTVADQYFQSAAVYPETKRFRVCTSKRAIGNDGYQADQATSERRSRKVQLNGHSNSARSEKAADWRLKILTSLGTFISLLGIGGQFTGLRGMHWTASIAQLGAVILMTGLRAMVRRHLANGINHRDLTPGFELDWFVMSLATPSTAPWLPEETGNESIWKKVCSKSWYLEMGKAVKLGLIDLWKKFKLKFHGADTEEIEQFKDVESEPALRVWKIETGMTDGNQESDDQTSGETDVRNDGITYEKRFREVLGLPKANSILLLRRYLGELGNWKSPALSEAISLARAIEASMKTFAPYLKETVEIGQNFTWTLKVREESSKTSHFETISFNVKRTSDGWAARADELDAALSLWLYSVSLEVGQEGDSASIFPTRDDLWIRGGKIQKRRCLRILGPSTTGLLRDLEWWMPNGLKGILAAQVQRSPKVGGDEAKSFPHMVQAERIARSGERWPDFDESSMTPFIEANRRSDSEEFKLSWKDQPSSESGELQRVTHWKWLPAEDIHTRNRSRERAISCPLIVESQDSLETLYAKDIFSSFVWALSSRLKPSSISKNLKADILSQNLTGMNTVTLRNKDLSSLVEAIVGLGRWAEHEVYLSLIPPLSATDNLPGLDAVVDLALNTALDPEKDRNWPQAQIPYKWLSDIAMSFPPTNYIYWKSIAVLLRLYTRMNTPKVRTFRSQRDDVYESQSLPVERAKIGAMLYKDDKNVAGVRQSLERMFNVHHLLKPFLLSTDFGSNGESWDFLGRREAWSTDVCNVFRIQKDTRDIFNFTALHHAMRSSLAGDADTYWTIIERLSPHTFRERWHTSRERWHTSRERWHTSRERWHTSRQRWHGEEPVEKYFKNVKSSLEDINILESNPTHWSENLSEALMTPDRQCHELLKNRADVNALDMDHWTPLHHACFLVMPKYPPQRRQSYNDELRSAWMLSATDERRREIAMRDFYMERAMKKAKVLILHKADVNARGLDGFTPLHCAIVSGNAGLVDFLLQNGAEVKATEVNGRTPMHLAALKDRVELFPQILEHEPDIHAPDRAGRTPLHLAAMYGATESIIELLNLGADPGARDDCGRTPLHIASLYNFCNGIKVLLQDDIAAKFGGANVKDDKGRTPLHLAALFNSREAIRTLLKDPIGRVDVQDSEGHAPLHLAVMSKAFNAVGDLMNCIGRHSKHTWPPIDKDGRTPFHLAASEGHTDTIKKMVWLMKKFKLESTAIFLKTKSDKMGAFSTAVSRNHLPSAWALLEAAAESGLLLREQMLEELDDSNETILAEVVYREREDTALELIEQGANVNVTYERNGRNLLHYAVEQNMHKLEEVLRSKVENLEDMLNKKDIWGDTPNTVSRIRP